MGATRRSEKLADRVVFLGAIPTSTESLPRSATQALAVERTFAWLCQNRRFSRDYERLCTTGEALIYATMSRLMLRRLARI
jgi:hypothetical protein